MGTDNVYFKVSALDLDLGRFALRNISLRCGPGEYHLLLGPTGSGKSTLMKCILGFHRLRQGSIHLNGRDITGEPPERRRMGYVPQGYDLFPHLNVEEHLRFALRAAQIPLQETTTIENRLCGMLGLETLRKRSIRNLSGGEKQKVALGRALATRPEIILLDEPFSAIDEGARRTLWFELKNIINEVGIPALHITHNLEEAYTLGEKISVMINGEIKQSGYKEEVFEKPNSESIARYLNYRNIFSGIAEPHSYGTNIRAGHFSIIVKHKLKAGEKLKVCLRQQDIKLLRVGEPLKESLKHNVLEGEIVSLFPLPEYCLMWFKIAGSPQPYDLEIKFPFYLRERYNLHPGEKISLALREPKIIIWKE